MPKVILNSSGRTAALWMFLPLALGFVLVYFGVQDLKNPVSAFTDHCQVLAIGPAAGSLKNGHNLLYRHSDSSQDDLGFRCQKLGVVVINDHDPLSGEFKAGTPAEIQKKTYRWLPDSWKIFLVSK